MRLKTNQALKNLVASFEANQIAGLPNFLQDAEFDELIDYYQCVRQYDQVLEVLDLAISRHPFSTEYLIQKATNQLAAQEPRKALQTLDHTEVLCPGSLELQILKIECLTKLGELELAWLHIRDLPFIHEKQLLADALVAKAIWHEHQLEYEQMFDLLKEALDYCPNHLRALELLGTVVDACKRYSESVELHQKLIDEDPYSFQAWFNLGQAYTFEGRYEAAIEAYEYAFIIDPHFELAYREFIDLCFELRYYQKILNCYEDFEQYAPLDTDDYLCIGQCYQLLGKTEQAKTVFDQAARLDSFNDEVLFHIGECFAEKEDWHGALHYYNRAIEIDQKREEYFAARGEAYFMIESLEKAEEDMLRAAELAPENVVYTIQYCSFLMQFGYSKDALNYLDASDEIGAIEYLYCKIACLLLLGRRKEGIYWLVEALAEDFEAHPVLFEMVPALEEDPEIISLISSHVHYKY